MNIKHLLLVSVFALTSLFGFAQLQENTQSFFNPIIEQSDLYEDNTAILGVVGFNRTEGVIFPIKFEWRKNTEKGELIQKGLASQEFSTEYYQVENGKLGRVKQGTYVLIAYDNSSPSRKIVKEYIIK